MGAGIFKAIDKETKILTQEFDREIRSVVVVNPTLGPMAGRYPGVYSAPSIPGSPLNLSYRELVKATNTFSPSRKIGEGGFASVYEAWLPRAVEGISQKVAVKRLKVREGPDIVNADFMAELTSVNANHQFMVKLVGFCSEGPHRLLVYEFMVNGSLDKWIFGENLSLSRRNLLDWKGRYNVAIGVGQALTYCHEECRDEILHLDIKPQNILLDEELRPRLADFGAAKLRHRTRGNAQNNGEPQMALSRIMGTFGYAAPELFLEGVVSRKSDVYSFGIVLLELVAGRRAHLNNVEPEERRNFPAWTRQCLAKSTTSTSENGVHEMTNFNYAKELVDPRLGSAYDEEQVLLALKVGLWCIQSDPQMRPSMSEVVLKLQGHSYVLMPPQEEPSWVPSNINFSGTTSTIPREIQRENRFPNH